MSSYQRFQKNTDVPPDNSLLWTVGTNWKISQKTGIAYCPIGQIIDEDLGTGLSTEIEKPVKEREVLEYELVRMEGDQVIDSGTFWFYVSDFSGNGKFSAYAFEDLPSAEKKKAEVIRFAGYNKGTGAQTTLKTGGISNKPSYTPNKTTPSYTNKNTGITVSSGSVIQNTHEQYIITYTDPEPVSYNNKEQIANLKEQGYDFIPASLIRNNCWREPILGEDGKEVGTDIIFLMGKIINVKIPDKNSNG